MLKKKTNNGRGTQFESTSIPEDKTIDQKI